MTAPVPSLFQIRLRAPHTATDAQWAETFHALSDNRDARIDAQKPLTLRLRTGGAGGPPANMGGAASGRADCAEARRDAAPPNAWGPLASAVWHAIGEPPVTIPVLREGADARVTIPALQHWSAGWLEF